MPIEESKNTGNVHRIFLDILNVTDSMVNTTMENSTSIGSGKDCYLHAVAQVHEGDKQGKQHPRPQSRTKPPLVLYKPTGKTTYMMHRLYSINLLTRQHT
ncbi:hypothetical protein PoB_005440400 [Plakobranchus ocellatus]|uniref:Uncharacterized protein n=1 Tax=Plakobranchus ocellatus TaxID=259542 RepID=A0AAV4CB20_9GAST|nr:hypothetical protein PoB_005440400 [Plakobranchus ocellatus]